MFLHEPYLLLAGICGSAVTHPPYVHTHLRTYIRTHLLHILQVCLVCGLYALLA